MRCGPVWAIESCGHYPASRGGWTTKNGNSRCPISFFCCFKVWPNVWIQEGSPTKPSGASGAVRADVFTNSIQIRTEPFWSCFPFIRTSMCGSFQPKFWNADGLKPMVPHLGGLIINKSLLYFWCKKSRATATFQHVVQPLGWSGDLFPDPGGFLKWGVPKNG